MIDPKFQRDIDRICRQGERHGWDTAPPVDMSWRFISAVTMVGFVVWVAIGLAAVAVLW